MKTQAQKTLLISAILLATVAGVAISDSERHSKEGWFSNTVPGINQTTTTLYQGECGSCHMAYQPGLLPPQSWETIMADLDNHFGENAELMPKDLTALRNFLLDNAAGRVNYRLSNKLMAAQRGKPFPQRITQMHYFRHEHSELGPTQVTKNPQVKSLSQCDRCHQGAAQGLYDEHDVSIPGFGRWDD